MTLSQTITLAYNTTLGGFINGEKFTKERFTDQVCRMMRGSATSYIFQMALPDGEWFAEILKGSWGFDLYIPETRGQESRLLDKLLGK